MKGKIVYTLRILLLLLLLHPRRCNLIAEGEFHRSEGSLKVDDFEMRLFQRALGIQYPRGLLEQRLLLLL